MIDLDWDQGGSMEVVRIGKKKKNVRMFGHKFIY